MDGMIVDGVGYTPGQIRRLVQERHLLADDNAHLTAHNRLLRSAVEERANKALKNHEEAIRLRLQIERLQRAAESQQVHLQRRTAALVRLIARKGPRLS